MLGRMKMIGAAAAVLATAGIALPADAQWRGRYPQHRHRDRVDGGDLLLGAIIAGGIIALASSADKSRRDRDRERYDEPPPPADAPVERPGPYTGPEGADAEPAGDGGQAPFDVADEDGAVDSCAAAAENEGRALARIAQVTGISGVDTSGNGWTVRGTVELTEGYRGQRRPYGFTCSVARGGAPNVRIEGGRYSAR